MLFRTVAFWASSHRIAPMAFAIQLTEELKTTWKLNNFQAKWEARAAHPEQLASEVLYISGWGFRVTIGEAVGEAGAGKVSAYLSRVSDNHCMLHVRNCSLS